jgi:hypothetical protein
MERSERLARNRLRNFFSQCIVETASPIWVLSGVTRISRDLPDTRERLAAERWSMLDASGPTHRQRYAGDTFLMLRSDAKSAAVRKRIENRGTPLNHIDIVYTL